MLNGSERIKKNKLIKLTILFIRLENYIFGEMSMRIMKENASEIDNLTAHSDGFSEVDKIY